MLKPLMQGYDSFVPTEKTQYKAKAKGEKTYYVGQINRKEKRRCCSSSSLMLFIALASSSRNGPRRLDDFSRHSSLFACLTSVAPVPPV